MLKFAPAAAAFAFDATRDPYRCNTVREGAMVAAFTFAGLPDSDAVTISVLFGADSFVVGALGGLAWILSGDRVQIATWHGAARPAPNGQSAWTAR